MDRYASQFYDLLSRAFGGDTSSARLQVFVDTVLADKYNALNVDGFDFAPDMQLEFTYEQIQKELGITAMANYYDLDSPAVPSSAGDVTVATGSIPRMKNVEYFNEDKVRKQMILEKMLPASQVGTRAKMALFNTIDTLTQAHTNSLTYQRHQMVSRRGLTLNDSNNPKGIVGITFSANVPDANVSKITGNRRFWTDKGTYATEGSTANPVADIIDWLAPIFDKGLNGHIEVSKPYWRRILRHSGVLKALAAEKFPLAADQTNAAAAASYMTEDAKTETLAQMIGCPIKVIDSKVAVEKYDKTLRKSVKTTVNAFEQDVLVFVPDGKIGEILTVMPLPFAGASASSTLYDGRLLITVADDPVKKCQTVCTEMTSLCVPEVPQYMYYLYPNE